MALYVGKAVTGKGLPQRLGWHVDLMWLELIDLLALSWKDGNVLSPFGGRVLRLSGEKQREQPDPLTAQSNRRARDWLQDSVVWSWIACSADKAAELERAAIHSLQPLLNFNELPRYPPPLMRAAIRTRVRAQWLWHMSWAGLFVGSSPARLSAAQRKLWQVGDPDARYHADELGYPITATSGTRDLPQIGRSDCPAGAELWELFKDAADEAPGWVRHALGNGMRRDQLEVWWAAHAATPLLPQPATAEQALAASLSLAPVASRPGPAKLPSPGRCEELSRLAATLPRFTH